MTGKTDAFGIKLTFYGGLAFILAIFGQTLLCGLLLGFSILAVKDRWLCRQVMQAFLLCFITSIVALIRDVFDIFDIIPIVGSLLNGAMNIISWAAGRIVLVLSILGLYHTAKGKEANIPIINIFVEQAFGQE